MVNTVLNVDIEASVVDGRTMADWLGKLTLEDQSKPRFGNELDIVTLWLLKRTSLDFSKAFFLFRDRSKG